jgi:Na+-translocating ferredoxin:NAD+ oxidoreductase subunit G
MKREIVHILNGLFGNKRRGLVYNLLCLLILGLLTSPLAGLGKDVYEKVFLSQKEALSEVFGKGVQVTSENKEIDPKERLLLENQLGRRFNEDNFTVYHAPSGDNNGAEYAIILDELGKHYPITFIVGMSKRFEVTKVRVMVYREKIGANVRKRRFLKQFKGKSAASELKVNQDIDHITGATISSWAITAGVKKALAIVALLEEGQ